MNSTILLTLVREGVITQGVKDFLVDGGRPGGGWEARACGLVVLYMLGSVRLITPGGGGEPDQWSLVGMGTQVLELGRGG